MGPIGMWLAARTIRAKMAKYPAPYNEAAVLAALQRLRAAVSASDSGYLLGAFSYAGAPLELFSHCHRS